MVSATRKGQSVDPPGACGRCRSPEPGADDRDAEILAGGPFSVPTPDAPAAVASAISIGGEPRRHGMDMAEAAPHCPSAASSNAIGVWMKSVASR